MTYVVVDIETTTASLYGRKASPFLESNYIVALGYRPKGLKTVGEYFPSYHKENLFDCVRGFKLLVGHNIKFDIMHMIQNANARKQFLEWVAGGGKVWDTQLAEYLLRGCEQTSHMLSLDQVAPAYGGTHKVDAVKLLWEQGVDTPDIPQDLLMRYLVGDAEYPGDIGNTELVFLGQVEKARQVGQMQSIMLNMDALLFTIEAEFNGMSVNKPLGLDIAAQLRKDIAGAKERLDASLPKDLPFEFNWGSAQQLSALIFGGAVKYPAKFYKHQDGTSTKVDEWHEGMPALWYTMKTVDRPLLDGAGEPVRFKGGKQAGQVKTCKVSVPDFEKGPKTRMEEAVYRFKGYTAPKPQWAGAVPGVYSVSSDVIEELGNRNIPFLKELSEFQAMQKDLSTYYVSEDGSKGLLTLVGEDGLVHHNLNMCSTVTGRLSSSRPNL